MKKLLILATVLFGFLPALSFAGGPTAQELDRIGLEHFKKAFYEATPRREHEKAASEYRRAEQAFQEAIKLQPDWVEPYLHLGRTYFVQKKYAVAAEMYRKAQALAPQRKEISLQLASALEMGGDYRGAVQVLQELRTREDDPRALAMLDDLIQRLEQRGRERLPHQPGGGERP
jgi:cytochrome c-type biogenesis protein CcmH/NrfG